MATAEKVEDRRPADSPEPAALGGLTTDAYMSVTNFLRDELRVITSDAVRMGDTFPDQTVPAGRTSPVSPVSAGWIPGQSHFNPAGGRPPAPPAPSANFKLSYPTTGEELTVDIGSWPNVTDVTYSADGGAGAVLAPLPGSGAEYAFLFFAGANEAKRDADSFIRANLPAIAAWIGANPVAIDLGGGATLTVSGLNVATADVPCRFATAYPATPDGAHWRLTAIMDVTGSVSGTLTWLGVSSGATVSVSKLTVLVQAIVDLSDPNNVSLTVNRLACSLADFSISGVLTQVIKVLFPTLYLELTSPYTLAGAVNTTFNQAIIDAVNAAIASWGKPHALAGAIAWIGLSGAGQVARSRRSPRETNQAGDYSTWMSGPAIQAMTLSELTMPGTHDSATFALEPVLSEKSYPDIAFLWRLSPDPAPADGSWPFPSGGIIHVGPELLKSVFDTVMLASTAQIYDLTQQLTDGIRFFDLRIYHDTDGHFYAQHALRGPKLEDLLAQVRRFIDAHPTAGELIFLQISATNFAAYQAAAMAQIIRDHLGAYVYMPPGARGVKDFDFQSLADLTVGGITAGAPKVIVLDPDSGYVYPDTVVNTSGFAGSGRDPAGTDSVTELADLEGAALDANTKPLYQVSWTLTPQPFDIAQTVLQGLSGYPAEFLLGHLARFANSALAGFLGQYRGRHCSLVTVDWYDTPRGAAPVQEIINLNYAAKLALARG